MLREVPAHEECMCPENAHMLVQTFSLLNQLIPIGLSFSRTHNITRLQGGYEEQQMIAARKFESTKYLLHDYLLLEKSDVKQSKTTPPDPTNK